MPKKDSSENRAGCEIMWKNLEKRLYLTLTWVSNRKPSSL